ncbi:PGPGW domain-containing protein [Nocardioides acrostichi]|uniref:PGPGW domain-containing protein n=1 Tax=Nocardioides acrostichi TaxID=2784339 RepID=A0A930V0J8_9ACTN|nr:PGPGW domain-containing protein [Nocardioides acrostichi]MBF4163481.1 PGPGW domain-containing protein [Nocardioides acrostichi]
MRARIRARVLSVIGWSLIVLGVVLYPLPGPGLLVLALGVGILARYDPVAARRLEPWRRRALRETARAVATRRRAAASLVVTLAFGAAGLLWIRAPQQPTWWPLPTWAWLPGGVWNGVAQLASGVLCAGLVGLARWAFVRNRLVLEPRAFDPMCGEALPDPAMLRP